MCGYAEPQQNSFKPNVMSEYFIPKTKETVVLNDNEPRLNHPTKGEMIRRDVYHAEQANKEVPVSHTPPPPATVRSLPEPKPVSSTKPVVQPTPTSKPTLIPAKPIPASAIKTPAEVAATSKSAVTAAPVVEQPLVANIIPTVEGQP